MKKNLLLIICINQFFINTTFSSSQEEDSYLMLKSKEEMPIIKRTTGVSFKEVFFSKKNKGLNQSRFAPGQEKTHSEIWALLYNPDLSLSTNEAEILAQKITLNCFHPSETNIKPEKIGGGLMSFYTGPMFAGKTESICRTWKITGESKSLIFSPLMDTRASKTESIIISHNKNEMPVIKIGKNSLDQILKIVFSDKKITTVFFDEIHFFHPEIIFIIKKILDTGIEVHISGLNLTSENIPFLCTAPILLLLADFIVTKKERCSKCQRLESTEYTRYKGDKKDTILIGGDEIYYSVCQKCNDIDYEPSVNQEEYWEKIKKYKKNTSEELINLKIKHSTELETEQLRDRIEKLKKQFSLKTTQMKKNKMKK